ncbi:MAG: hypothetical protein ABFR02_08635 [Campylobacterota bacterium]
MKLFTLSILLLLINSTVKADDCSTLKAVFEKEEKAYDTVARIAIAGNSSYAIIGKFIKKGTGLLEKCPKSYSLDRQYTLKRKIAKAEQYQQSYKVFTLYEIGRYARSHPEEIIVYKWGTIRPVQ